MCARVYVGGRKEPPASQRLGHYIPIERGPASPLRYPRVPTTTVTWSARAPIPSIFRLCPPPQFSNRDLRSRTLRSSSFAFPNLQFPTEDPLLSFPFLSCPSQFRSRIERTRIHKGEGGIFTFLSAPLFLFAPILCSIGSNCQFQFGGKRKMAERVERRKTDFDGASRTVGWNGTERAEDRRFLSEGNGWNLGATLGENGFLSRWRTVPRCHIRPGAG